MRDREANKRKKISILGNIQCEGVLSKDEEELEKYEKSEDGGPGEHLRQPSSASVTSRYRENKIDLTLFLPQKCFLK